MRLKKRLITLLDGVLPHYLFSFVPSGYSLIGDILVVRLNEIVADYSKLIGEALLKLEPRAKVVVWQQDTVNALRQPIIKHVAGEIRTTTIHAEFNTKFYLDVAKVTFSPGNKEERKRMIELTENGEIICDMYACVGNLSLPIAVNHKDTKLIGIEKNPIAFEFLKHNIKLNNVSSRSTAILGDNRDVTPKAVASRVIMGFFYNDYKQLRCAVEALDKKGWIHYHALVKRGEEEKLKEYVVKAIKQLNVDINRYILRKVKKFSPSKSHVCIDIYLKKHNG